MLAKLKAAYARFVATKAGAIANRVAVVAVVAFVAKFVESETAAHLLSAPNYLDLSLWHQTIAAAFAAAVGAVLTFVQSFLLTLATGVPQLSKRARAVALLRRYSARG